MEVSTTDFAGNLVEGPALLLITVIDQNDNRPIFKESRYTGEVLEGSPTVVYILAPVHTHMQPYMLTWKKSPLGANEKGDISPAVKNQTSRNT
ncbi:Cadherin-13 [Dissostichus eleginoides]|uniref:Cadherin-13 n=1 Tax=Dissostichus eleginoides TaxID=100907 RepID=A0AAD9F403_DISEL|nr:Cadherin-13 [Dissostichus eleginoides]